MSLRVYTARITYVGEDRFDVSRQSGGRDAAPFAPSWAILRPAIAARRKAAEMRPVNAARADEIEANAWATYVPQYRAEMLASWRDNREAWLELLRRETATLCCYCVSQPGQELRCHRRLLAGYLEKLGAVYCGEHAEARRVA